MVEVLLWIGIAAHILYWGNKDFLLREFSLEPMNLHQHWHKNMHARIWMFSLAFIIPFFLPITLKLKLLLLVFLAARFLYQSYDVIILFKKRFATSILFESIAFLIIALWVWYNSTTITLNRLVAVYTLSEIIKALGMYLVFRKEFPLRRIGFHWEYFRNALPFFLLGFTGLFQSKVDLICVTIFLSKTQIAQYQVYMGFLLLVQSSSSFILAPFAKNIYRLKKDSIMRIAFRLLIIGIITSAIAIPMVNYIIIKLYHFSLPMAALLSGGLFVIPVFYYSPIIYYLLKLNSQRKILLINIVGITLAFTLNMILIPTSTNGISGATDAIAITQWVLLIICVITGKVREPEIAKA
jgi:O-antigen/teichoic acid export membrane protein